MILEASVTDNLQLAGVYLRVFHWATEKMIVDSIGGEEEPELMDRGNDAHLVRPWKVKAKHDPLFNLDNLMAEANFEDIGSGLKIAPEKFP